LRVIAGKYRSRRLRSLQGMDIRPTSDRLRETLFDVLTAGNPSALEATTWVDLYAGTGAVGIEALSRGAKNVYFVERSRDAANLVQQNLRSLEIHGGFEIMKVDAIAGLRRLNTSQADADFIFLDPPYQMPKLYAQSLAFLALSHLLSQTTIVIAEHEKKFDPGERFGGLQRYRKLEQGDAALSFYRLA
jgi:16S rRNA (guanine966-N2)-methyltransferase